MEAIVNVSSDWGIGSENRLLVTISDDLCRFRKLTEGKVVVLGRKTLETFPNGKPLKNRRNLILSKNPDYCVEGTEVFHDLSSMRDLLRTLPQEDICVIGGESIYRALLPYCDRVRLTKTLCTAPADRFFPNLDTLPNWSQTDCSPIMEENGLQFQYIDYVNQSPMPL